MPALNTNNEEAQELMNKEVQIMRWGELISRCKNLDYKKRTQELYDHYTYDHPSFIDQLKKCAYDPPLENFFSSLFQISMLIENEDRYVELMAQSCAFYRM